MSLAHRLCVVESENAENHNSHQYNPLSLGGTSLYGQILEIKLTENLR